MPLGTVLVVCAMWARSRGAFWTGFARKKLAAELVLRASGSAKAKYAKSLEAVVTLKTAVSKPKADDEDAPPMARKAQPDVATSTAAGPTVEAKPPSPATRGDRDEAPGEAQQLLSDDGARPVGTSPRARSASPRPS